MTLLRVLGILLLCIGMFTISFLISAVRGERRRTRQRKW